MVDVYEIEHFSEIYAGDRLNRIGERIEQHTLPFVTRILGFMCGRAPL